MGEPNGTTLQGSDLKFEQIPNHEQFIAIGNSSDNNDRYTPIPHPSYEFKIPTDIIGRESVYGFYFKVHDSKSNTDYTYPQNLHDDFVATPDKWGEIYSPDKSLPEFDFPIMLFLIGITTILFFTRSKIISFKNII